MSGVAYKIMPGKWKDTGALDVVAKPFAMPSMARVIAENFSC